MKAERQKCYTECWFFASVSQSIQTDGKLQQKYDCKILLRRHQLPTSDDRGSGA